MVVEAWLEAGCQLKTNCCCMWVVCCTESRSWVKGVVLMVPESFARPCGL
jgi:hypothetical protein